MPYPTTLNPGDPTSSSWANTIRDQTVLRFANSAARGAAVTSPTEGMVSYLDDTNALEVYYPAPIGWRPPWNVPWGMLGKAFNTTGGVINALGVNVPNLSLSVTFVTGRQYRASFNIPFQKRTNAGTASAEVYDGTTKFGGASLTLQPAEYGMLVGSALVTGSGAKTFTVLGGADTVDIALNVSAAYPAYFLIEDIGPV